MTVLDELLVELGFDYDPKDLKTFQAGLDKSMKLVKQFAKTVAVGTTALTAFVVATTRATDEHGKLAKEIGIEVQKLDALEFASQRAGGAMGGLSSSLQQLSIRIGETARGTGSGLEAFGLLGISVTKANGELKETDQVLLEVSDRFENFSKSQQLELADKLGLRETIRLLQVGSVGIKELMLDAEALGTVTEKDAILSEQFQDSLVDVWQIVKQLSRVITRSLVPAMEDNVNAVTEWWIRNKDLIEQNIPEYIDKATKALKLLTLAALAFIGVKLLTTFAALLTLMKGLTVSTLLLNAAMLIIPALIAAAIAAIVLLAQDAKVFFEGGESFIGDMIAKYPKWEKQLERIAAVFAVIAKLTGMIGTGWKMLFETVLDGSLFANLKRDYIRFVNFMVEKVTTAAKTIRNKLKEAFTFSIPRLAISFGGGVRDRIEDMFGTANGGTTIPPMFAGSMAYAPSNVPGDNDYSNSTSSSKSTVFQGDINISVPPTNSPGETAEYIEQRLRDLADQTATDLNSAVKL